MPRWHKPRPTPTTCRPKPAAAERSKCCDGSEGSNQGQQQPLGLSFGTFSRGQNANIHEIHRALITAAEMQQDLRTDDQIIVTDTGMPIRCGRCLWYRRPEIQALIEG